jgi:hypothetical protein
MSKSNGYQLNDAISGRIHDVVENVYEDYPDNKSEQIKEFLDQIGHQYISLENAEKLIEIYNQTQKNIKKSPNKPYSIVSEVFISFCDKLAEMILNKDV